MLRFQNGCKKRHHRKDICGLFPNETEPHRNAVIKGESQPPMSSHSSRLVVSRMALALLFCTMGVLHFARPDPFLKVMPPIFPAPYALVLISGMFEFLGGAGVLIPRLRRAAGIGLIALLIAVYPVNIFMFWRQVQTHAWDWTSMVLLVRLPLQFVLIWWIVSACQLTRKPRPSASGMT